MLLHSRQTLREKADILAFIRGAYGAPVSGAATGNGPLDSLGNRGAALVVAMVWCSVEEIDDDGALSCCWRYRTS